MAKNIYTLYSEQVKKIILTLWRDEIADGFCNSDGGMRIFFVTDGSGSITHDGITERFSVGDTFIFDSSQSFTVSETDRAEAFFMKFNFSDFIDAEVKVFPKSVISDFLSRIEASGKKLPGIHINTKKIRDALFMIENEFENQRTYFVIKAYVILILSLAVQYLSDTTEAGGINRCAYYKDIEKSLVYISDHLSEKLILDDLARVANMGKTNYSVAFKNVTGMTVWEYILNSRIELASSYLVEKKDDFNITEIAMMSGFNSTAHFTNVFKKIKGNTPSEFKNNPKNPCF